MNNQPSVNEQSMILIALVQGFSLLLLHQAIELDFWPHHSPHWLFAFYSIAFIGPTLLLLSIDRNNVTRLLKFAAPFVLLSGLLGYYAGFQATPIEHVSYDTVLFGFINAMVLATFLALFFINMFSNQQDINYKSAFILSWRNTLTLALSLLFTLVTWGILMLWAELFRAIEIDFFRDLFTERWFYYPVLALANGFGVVIFRRFSNVIDTIVKLLQALFTFLLVLLVFVAIIFLFTLPFSGLEPLWDSGGSALVLWLQALILFFVNAVYQYDANSRPYPVWIQRFILIGIVLLPVFSAISFYGLYLRVDQYGWSLSRCWAFVVWAILALFSVGYAKNIIQLRDHWLQKLSSINIAMSLVLLVVMLLVNSPLLDFRKVTVKSQLNRLSSEQVTINEFDYSYFKRHLARPGYLALEQMKQDYSESHPEVVTRIESLYRNMDEGVTYQQFTAKITDLSGQVPEAVLKKAYSVYSEWGFYSFDNTIQFYILETDMDGNGQSDYILFQHQNHDNLSYTLFYAENDIWQNLPTHSANTNCDTCTFEAALESIKAQEFSTKQTRWKDLLIGDLELKME